MAKPALRVVDKPEDAIKIGYARVSTADQNPQMQIDALILSGVDERDIWVETISGAAKDRPQLEGMMKDVRAGDLVCIWKLDRLGRDAQELYRIYERIRAKGADLSVITQPGMDSSTATGRFLFGALAIMAQFERDISRERTTAGLVRARREGRFGGSKAKYAPEVYLEAAKLGMQAGAKKLGMSLSGFIKAVEREQARMKKGAAA